MVVELANCAINIYKRSTHPYRKTDLHIAYNSNNNKNYIKRCSNNNSENKNNNKNIYCIYK